MLKYYWLGRSVPYLNQIVSGLDSEYGYSYVWIRLCPWISFTDPISTSWHAHTLVCALFWIQWCICFRICMSFWVFPIWSALLQPTQCTNWHTNDIHMDITWNRTYPWSLLSPLSTSIVINHSKIDYWSNCMHGQIADVPSYYSSKKYEKWKTILQHCILNEQHLMVPSILLDGLGSVCNKKSGNFSNPPLIPNTPCNFSNFHWIYQHIRIV